MTQAEFNKFLWDAIDKYIRGNTDAADFKQYIFPFLFFKRLSDVWDEEYKVILEAENDVDEAKHRLNHRFQIPEDCHWDDVRKVSENVGAALQNAFNKIEAANQEHKFTDIFGDAQWTNKRRFSDELLQKLMEHFSQINFALTNVPHDMMGLGYEYLIGKFADDGGHTAAEFYTNATVAQLMCQLTDVQPRESVKQQKTALRLSFVV